MRLHYKQRRCSVLACVRAEREGMTLGRRKGVATRKRAGGKGWQRGGTGERTNGSNKQRRRGDEWPLLTRPRKLFWISCAPQPGTGPMRMQLPRDRWNSAREGVWTCHAGQDNKYLLEFMIQCALDALQAASEAPHCVAAETLQPFLEHCVIAIKYSD